MSRSFDVVPERDPDGPRADLERMTHNQQVGVFAKLQALRNEDVFAMKKLAWPRGDHGAWVYLKLGEWFFLCQWDRGTPSLWREGIGRGRLTICRIVDGPGFDEILAERKRAAQ
jgi:hypothetical protein